MYTDIIINFRSKPTPINGPVNKSELKISYSKSHFSRLPQAFYKRIINRLSHKVSYDYITIDSVIYGFITNKLRSDLHIFDHSIITSGKYDCV